MATMPYIELIGCLLYLARRNRLHICYEVGVLCRFTSDPSRHHWVAEMQVLRYLAGTRDYIISLGTQSETSKGLIAYSDSEWAGDKDDRKSTSGYRIFLNGELIAWSLKKQKCIAL